MLGMIAEPVIYLVVWTTIADQHGGSVHGLTAGYFAAYYIVWTLVRNMNIVFGAPFWEHRIREGELNRDLLRPVLPLHYDIAYFAGWKVVVIVLWIPLAIALSFLFDPDAQSRTPSRSSRSPSPSGARISSERCSRRASGCSASGRPAALRSSTSG